MKYVYRLRVLDRRTGETVEVEEVSGHRKLGLLKFMRKALPYRNRDHKILCFESNDVVRLGVHRTEHPEYSL